MKTACLAVLLGATLACAADWPTYLGPQHNNSVPCAAPLVERFTDARLAWTSDMAIPNAMAGDGLDPLRDGRHWVSGGYGAPIVAAGRVYVQYYVPVGTAVDAFVVATYGERFRDKFRIEADDVLHCFDAATGKTLWRKVLEKTSLNFQMFTKAGPSLTPAYADGRIYMHVTGGRVFCLDAADQGRILWEYKTARYACQETLRAWAVQNQRLPAFNRDFKTSPTVIDGVVIFSDHLAHRIHRSREEHRWERFYDTPSNLVALDANTGRELWRLANGLSPGAQPVAWRCAGHSYLLANGGDSIIRCIEPRTGQVLWQQPTGEFLTPAVEGSVMVCREMFAVPATAPTTRPVRQYFHTAYRIDEKGAIKLWSRPGFSWPTVANGLLYCESTPRGKLLCVELSSGKVLATAPAENEPHFGYSLRVLGDRVLGGGADHDNLHLYAAGAQNFRLLEDAPIINAWGYEMPLLPALADGSIYLRTQSRLVCIDLRRGSTAGIPLAGSQVWGHDKNPRHRELRAADPSLPPYVWIPYDRTGRGEDLTHIWKPRPAPATQPTKPLPPPAR